MDNTKNGNGHENKVKMKSLAVDYNKYRTLFTKKFENRKKYCKPDVKKIFAFLPGTINKIYVKPGRKVKEGDKLLILEAMKMNNDLLSPINGTIKKIYVERGDRVTKEQVLIELE